MNRPIRFFDEPLDFSLVLGGPLYQLYLRTRLAKPPLALLYRRIITIPLFSWLPLLALTVWGGHAVGGVDVPFLVDLDTHARFLVALPLLIVAELVVHQRMRPLIRQFLERDLVAAEDRARFEEIVASAMRLRNSVGLEVVLIVFAFTAGHWVWVSQLALDAPTWYSVKLSGQPHFTVAGYWYAFVSLPIFRFLAARWYVRFFIWYRFLWQVSRLRLRVNPLHPDRAGGLGFLETSVEALAPVLLAHSVLLAGLIANRIWHQGAALPEFKGEIAGGVGFLMVLVLAPLMFFLAPLAAAKRSAVLDYGALASRYVDDFRTKWRDGNPAGREALLGTADIQSLADLTNSLNVVREMRVVPFGRNTIVVVAVTLGLPLAPLALTMVPLDQLIRGLVGLLL